MGQARRRANAIAANRLARADAAGSCPEMAAVRPNGRGAIAPHAAGGRYCRTNVIGRDRMEEMVEPRGIDTPH